LVDIKCYNNDTVYGLRKKIAEEIKKIGWSNMVICGKETGKEILDTENGTTIRNLKIKINERIVLSQKPTMLVSKVPILDSRRQFVPKAIDLFTDAYKEYSDPATGTWGRKEAGRFTGVVLGQGESSVDVDDQRVKNLFDKWDPHGTGILSIQSVLSFYLDAAQTREIVVWDNIKNLGYRVDLTKLSDDVAEELKEEDSVVFLMKDFRLLESFIFAQLNRTDK